MNLLVYVFDDNVDAVERCFEALKDVASIDVSEVKTRPRLGYQLSFDINSLGTAPIQVFVGFSVSTNKLELKKEIEGLCENFDLVLIDDHYEFDALAGQSFILPLLIHRLKRHATLLPIFCLFTEHYAREEARLASFRVQTDALSASDTVITGIPKEPARLLEVLRWAAVLKRSAELGSTAQARLKIAGLDREIESPGPVGRGRAGKKPGTDLDWFVGESPVSQAIDWNVSRYGRRNANVLILGERGTGKTEIANAIHRASARKDRKFLKIDLGKIPESLIESELFGHTARAFSGANDARVGLLEAAHTGTVFFEEVGNMPMPQQRRLHSFLDDGCITPLGSNESKHLDVRVIAATNKDLDKAVRCGEFMPDLLDRLNVLMLVVPPLRERGDDILKLAEHLVRRQVGAERQVALSDEVRAGMLNFGWPGNVRELNNMITRAVTLLEGDEHALELRHFPGLSKVGADAASGSVASPWSIPNGMRTDVNTMIQYVGCVKEYLVERGGAGKITLSQIGRYASGKRGASGSKEDSARRAKSPEKAFINHLNSNSEDWARCLLTNRPSLSNEVVSIFLLSQGIEREYQRLKA